MKCYIYNWSISEKPKASALLENGLAINIEFDGYQPFFYLRCDPNFNTAFLEDSGILDVQSGLYPLSSGYYKVDYYYKITCKSLVSYNRLTARLNKSYSKLLYKVDEPFYSFLSSLELDPVGPYVVDSETKTKASFSNCKMSEEDFMYDPTVLTFDIECEHSKNHFPSPTEIECNILCIGVMINSKSINKKLMLTMKESNLKDVDFDIITFSSELEMINSFLALIDEYNVSCVTSYNGNAFDMGYIRARLGLYLAKPNGVEFEASVSPIGINKNRVVNNIVCSKAIMLDVYEHIRTSSKIEPKTLDNVSQVILGDKKAGKYDDFYIMYRESRNIDYMDKVLIYCMKDVDLTYRLFVNQSLWALIMSLSRIQRFLPRIFLLTGKTVKSTNMIIDECVRRNIIFDSLRCGSSTSYTGALNYAMEGIYYNCANMDFFSHYPVSAMLHNICQFTLLPQEMQDVDCFNINVGDKINRFAKNPIGIFTSIWDRLISTRLELTKINKELKSSNIAIKILALKLAANSLYGILGSREDGPLVCREAAESITAVGRLLISAAKLIVNEKYGYIIPYIDTDSLMITFGRDIDPSKIPEICKLITDAITASYEVEGKFRPRLDYKSTYEKIMFLTMKKYIYIDKGKVNYSGCDELKKDKCKFMRDRFIMFVEAVMRDKPIEEIVGIVRETYMLLISNSVPIEDLLMSKSHKKNYTRFDTNNPIKNVTQRLIMKGLELDSSGRIDIIYMLPKNYVGEPMSVSEYTYAYMEYDPAIYRVYYEAYINDIIYKSFDKILNVAKLGNVSSML